MYSRFAQVYDRLMDDFDYPKWADYYLMLIEKAGCRPKTLCECGCGTGSMTLEFARRGLKTTGIDLSEDMLELAQQKARKAGLMIPFVCQNMTCLELPRKVDVIAACCDGVNYLTDMQQVSRFFYVAYEQLKPGGVLAFDISSEYKLLGIMGNAFFGEDRDEVTYLWQNHRDGQLLHMELSFFVQREDGLYERFDEEQTQRAHSIGELTDALINCGFDDIRIYGDQILGAPGPEEKRIHFTAKKAVANGGK